MVGRFGVDGARSSARESGRRAVGGGFGVGDGRGGCVGAGRVLAGEVVGSGVVGVRVVAARVAGARVLEDGVDSGRDVASGAVVPS